MSLAGSNILLRGTHESWDKSDRKYPVEEGARQGTEVTGGTEGTEDRREPLAQDRRGPKELQWRVAVAVAVAVAVDVAGAVAVAVAVAVAAAVAVAVAVDVEVKESPSDLSLRSSASGSTGHGGWR
jgi:hypothetical protein